MTLGTTTDLKRGATGRCRRLLLRVPPLVLLLFAALLPAQPVFAAAGATFRALNDVIIYDPNGGNSCPTGGVGTSNSTTAGASASYSSDQVKTFAHEPITSTWNISDSSAEQWFLSRGTAKAVIEKYGLNSTNIGNITSVVKAAGVSPVYFYLYTVNEGGGLGGFINHYSSDTGGGGAADAKRDAEYIASQAQKTGDNPAWIDVDNYVDFVPQDVKAAGDADFRSMPTGTIGRIYIPATAAAAWETYYPNGLLKEYNKVRNYGGPLGDSMKMIKSMGGDPMQGGAPISSGSCGSAGLTGTGIAKAISWAEMIANNDGYGYDQPGRATGWAKWQSDPNCTHQCGSLDCSSLISAALTVAGYFTTNPEFTTSDEGAQLKQVGFTQVASSATTSAGLLPGDILITSGHTEMYVGNNQNVGAHENENHGASGGQVGDQTGHEVSVGAFYNDNWTSVWRAPSK